MHNRISGIGCIPDMVGGMWKGTDRNGPSHIWESYIAATKWMAERIKHEAVTERQSKHARARSHCVLLS